MRKINPKTIKLLEQKIAAGFFKAEDAQQLQEAYDACG